jgi:hypothetical protein
MSGVLAGLAAVIPAVQGHLHGLLGSGPAAPGIPVWLAAA